MTKDKKGQWIRLSPRDIYLRLLEIEEWKNKAEKAYGFKYERFNSIQVKSLSADEKTKVNDLFWELLRKTGAPSTCEVMARISEVFGLKNLVELCTQQKFPGLLGVNHVVNLALSSMIFESGAKKSFTNFGGVSIDHKKIGRVAIPMETHQNIQEKINENNSETNAKLFSIFEQIRVLHENKMYPLKSFIALGKEIEELTNENPMGHMLYQANISKDGAEKNPNFFSNEIVRKDGGFFQDLCILILSYEFPSFNQIQ